VAEGGGLLNRARPYHRITTYPTSFDSTGLSAGATRVLVRLNSIPSKAVGWQFGWQKPSATRAAPVGTRPVAGGPLARFGAGALIKARVSEAGPCQPPAGARPRSRVRITAAGRRTLAER
jgi:hypothetical protein